jgi:hypothetical protein
LAINQTFIRTAACHRTVPADAFADEAGDRQVILSLCSVIDSYEASEVFVLGVRARGSALLALERSSAETSAKQPLRGRMVIDAIHPKEIDCLE